MKEYGIPLLLSIVATLLNYIFISTITDKSRQTQVQDFKTILNFMMQELKSGQTAMQDEINGLKSDLLNEIKQNGKNNF